MSLDWAESRDACQQLSAKLPPGGSDKSSGTTLLHKYLVSKFQSSLWLEKSDTSGHVSHGAGSINDTCQTLTSSDNGDAAFLTVECRKKLTAVCIKGRKGFVELSLNFYC